MPAAYPGSALPPAVGTPVGGEPDPEPEPEMGPKSGRLLAEFVDPLELVLDVLGPVAAVLRTWSFMVVCPF